MNKSLIFSVTISLFLNTLATTDIKIETSYNNLEITTKIKEEYEINTNHEQAKKQELQKLTNKLVKLQAKLERLKELKKQKKSEGNFIEADQIKKAIEKIAKLLKTVSISIARVLGHLGGTIGASLTTFLIAFMSSWAKNFAIQKTTGHGNQNDFGFPGQNQHVVVNCGCDLGKQEVLKESMKQHLINSEADRAKLSSTLEQMAEQNGWPNKVKDHFVNSIINFTTNYVIYYGLSTILLNASSKVIP